MEHTVKAPFFSMKLSTAGAFLVCSIRHPGTSHLCDAFPQVGNLVIRKASLEMQVPHSLEQLFSPGCRQRRVLRTTT